MSVSIGYLLQKTQMMELYKKHKSKENPDKTAGTPDNCFIENGDITESPVPAKLDRQWYIDLAKERVQGKNGFLK